MCRSQCESLRGSETTDDRAVMETDNLGIGLERLIAGQAGMAVERRADFAADSGFVRALRQRRIEEAADEHVVGAGPREGGQQFRRAAGAAATGIVT